MAPAQPPGSPRHAATMRATNLAALARETKRKLDWDRLLVLRDSDGAPTQWKWLENARNFSIYAKHEPPSPTGDRVTGTHAVLAVGTVKASRNEVAALLVAHSQDEYVRKMTALHDKDYKDGAYVYDIDTRASYQDATNDELDEPLPTKLSVRTLTFAKSGGWLASHDEWCHLDAVYEDQAAGRFEQVLTALRPRDVLSSDRKLSANTKYVRDGVFGAYRIDEQRLPPTNEAEAAEMLASSRVGGAASSTSHRRSIITGGKPRFSSRVHFYAEMPQAATPTSMLGALTVAASKSDASSEKATKARLTQVARSCHRLSLLIRRRRLGMQALVSRSRFLPPTNTACFRCGASLLVAKLCRVCGQGVCGDCSDKYERETFSATTRTSRVESVRVCDPCLNRVESSDYSSIRDTSLVGPRVVADPKNASADGDTQAAEAELRYLLREALVEAKSPEHKASVMKVIRCVIDDDDDTRPKLTPKSSIGDFTRALDEQLHIDTIPFDQASYRDNEDRAYRMDTRDVDGVLCAPLSDDEEERLRAVAQVDIDQLADSVELDILCDLAASEMGCTMSTISIFDRENLNCVATNFDVLHKTKLPRSNTPCAHTILENKPNLVAHPEADIRYADSLAVQKLGAKFYFAFPIVDVSEHVIGSFCVMNDETMEVTETKYTAFKKLADTCNKVVRIHTEQQRRTSSVSNGSS